MDLIITDEDRRLLELSDKLESQKLKDDLIFQAETMVRAQEALKADYPRAGQDAPCAVATA